MYISVHTNDAHLCVKHYNESSSAKQISETYVWWHQRNEEKEQKNEKTNFLYMNSSKVISEELNMGEFDLIFLSVKTI